MSQTKPDRSLLLTDADLARWQALVDAATPGPWVACGDYGIETASGATVAASTEAHGEGGIWQTADRVFILAARHALPTLIAEVRRLSRLVSVARGAVELPRHDFHCSCCDAVLEFLERLEHGHD